MARPKPLVSPRHDVVLLQKIRGRRIPTLAQLREFRHTLPSRERLLFRIASLGLFASLIWFGIVLIGQYRTPVPAVGGTYREAEVGTPSLINPLFASLNDVDMDIARLVYSGLMRVDTKGRLVPDLATDYTVSPDKKVYTFNLRKDVVWHDGEPFTANDVVFTFDAIENSAIGSPLAFAFQHVTVEAKDDQTVVFTLPEPFASFLSSLSVGILPQHIWEGLLPEKARIAPQNLQPIGTGPFMFKKFTRDQNGHISSIELERFDRYYRQAPFLQTFVFSFFSKYDGDGEAIDALRKEQVTALHFVPKEFLSKVERKNIALHTLQLPEYTALFFNQKGQPLLAKDTLREALALGLDRERILKETLGGEGKVIEGPVLPGAPGYDPDETAVLYSPDKANALLDASWTRVPAETYKEERRKALVAQYLDAQKSLGTPESLGLTTSTVPADVTAHIEEQLTAELPPAQTFFRKDKEGHVLALNLVTIDTAEYRSAAERVAGFWQQIGVETLIRTIPADPVSVKKEILKDRNFDILLYSVIVGSDPDQYPFWHSSQAENGFNLAGFKNDKADALLVKARAASDDETIASSYAAFEKIVAKERPAIFLYTPTYTYASLTTVHGQEMSQIYVPADRFAGVISWYVKTKGVWQL